MYLGVPNKNTPVEVPTIKKDGSSQAADIAIMTKEGEVHAHTLSPVELVNVSDLVACSFIMLYNSFKYVNPT